MSEFDALAMRVAALGQRLSFVEESLREVVYHHGPQAEAAAVAERAGIDPRVMLLRRRMAERRRLIQVLLEAGWPPTKIARVMACSERTVERIKSKVQSPKSKVDGRERTQFQGMGPMGTNGTNADPTTG